MRVISAEPGNEGVGANLVFALSGCAVAPQKAITRIAPTATFRIFDKHTSLIALLKFLAAHGNLTSRCRIAQLAERLTLDQEVLGSNPSPAAISQYRFLEGRVVQ